MKSINAFLPYVMPFVMGCPKAVARQAILSAAIELCEESRVIQRLLDPLNTRANTREVDLDAPSQQTVIMPMRAWFKGTELRPAASEHVANVLAFRDDTPDVELATGDPREFVAVLPAVIALHPVPETAETGAITVRAALKPKRNATQLEDELFDNWVETIAAGALYRLHSHAGQPFSDQLQAQRRFTEFRLGLNKARIEAIQGRTRGPLTAQMRPLA